ncbi:hypothetical protein [Lentibacillus halophilus]|uniref:hypothetical protein n=1 Tax=Lentibacillus halophilus TaxID=295065 RepID=UPI0031DAC901
MARITEKLVKGACGPFDFIKNSSGAHAPFKHRAAGVILPGTVLSLPSTNQKRKQTLLNNKKAHSIGAFFIWKHQKPPNSNDRPRHANEHPPAPRLTEKRSDPTE